MNSPSSRALLAGAVLALCTALCLVLILEINAQAAGAIRAQREARLTALIDSLLPEEARTQHDELVCRLVTDRRIGNNMPLYIARRGGVALGYILLYQTARGYSNPLIFIAGFDAQLNLYRVDIHFSRETPGLGDKIDRRHSRYLDNFTGKTLDNARWDVRKFGGDFDYFAGATVTSRSAVLATHDALETLQQLDLNYLPACKEGKP